MSLIKSTLAWWIGDQVMTRMELMPSLYPSLSGTWRLEIEEHIDRQIIKFLLTSWDQSWNLSTFYNCYVWIGLTSIITLKWSFCFDLCTSVSSRNSILSIANIPWSTMKYHERTIGFPLQLTIYHCYHGIYILITQITLSCTRGWKLK